MEENTSGVSVPQSPSAGLPEAFCTLWSDVMGMLDGPLGHIDDLTQQCTEYYNTCLSDGAEQMEDLYTRSTSEDLKLESSVANPPSPQLLSETGDPRALGSAVSTPDSERKRLICKSSSEDGSVGNAEWKKKNKSFWQGFRKLQKGSSVRESCKGDDVGFVASEITMSDEDRIQLMMMVKDKMITIEEALAKLKEYECHSKVSLSTDTVHFARGTQEQLDESSDGGIWEQFDDDFQEVKFKRLHKLVSSKRKSKKKLVKVDEIKNAPTTENTYDGSCSKQVESLQDERSLNLFRPKGSKTQQCLNESLQKPTVEDPATLTILGGSPAHECLEGQAGKKLLKPLHTTSENSATMPPKKCGRKSSDSECSEGKLHKLSHSPTDSEVCRGLAAQNHVQCECKDSVNSEKGGAIKSPTNSRKSLSRKVKSVKETVRRKITKTYSGTTTPQPTSDGVLPTAQFSDPADRSRLRLAGAGSVESLRSSLSGQSSMSGQTVSTTDSSASNRESVKSEDGEEEESAYQGPFCGRARVHTDFIPSPYDTDSLKLKKGDVIDIISKPPGGTWMGLLNNKVGTFKFIYMDVVNDEVEKPKRPRRRRRGGKQPKPQTVQELLQRFDLEQHMPTLLLNGYEDLDTFKLLQEEDLDELNILESEQRSRLLMAVELLHDYDSNSDKDLMAECASKEALPHYSMKHAGSDPQRHSPWDSGCFEESGFHENGKSRKSWPLVMVPKLQFECPPSEYHAIQPTSSFKNGHCESDKEKDTAKQEAPCSPPYVQFGHTGPSVHLGRCQRLQASASSEDLTRPHSVKRQWQRSYSFDELRRYNRSPSVAHSGPGSCAAPSQCNKPGTEPAASRKSVHSSDAVDPGEPIPTSDGDAEAQGEGSHAPSLQPADPPEFSEENNVLPPIPKCDVTSQTAGTLHQPTQPFTGDCRDGTGLSCLTKHKEDLSRNKAQVHHPSQPPPVPAKKCRDYLRKGIHPAPHKMTNSNPSISSRYGLVPILHVQYPTAEPASSLSATQAPCLPEAVLPETSCTPQLRVKLCPASGRKPPRMREAELETLIENKLESEAIDLTEKPHSDKHGRCGIPVALIQRYSEDLQHSAEQVAVAMDLVRVKQLRKQHRMAIPSSFDKMNRKPTALEMPRSSRS